MSGNGGPDLGVGGSSASPAAFEECTTNFWATRNVRVPAEVGRSRKLRPRVGNCIPTVTKREPKLRAVLPASEFKINGQDFPSDFEAALHIILKSKELNVGDFVRRVIHEQRRLARRPWVAELLKDPSLKYLSDHLDICSSSGGESTDPAGGNEILTDDEYDGVQVQPTALVATGNSMPQAPTEYVAAQPLAPNKPSVAFSGPETGPPPATHSLVQAPTLLAQTPPGLISKAPAPTGENTDMLAKLQKLRPMAENLRVCPLCEVEASGKTLGDEVEVFVCQNDACSGRSRKTLDRVVGWRRATKEKRPIPSTANAEETLTPATIPPTPVPNH